MILNESVLSWRQFEREFFFPGQVFVVLFTFLLKGSTVEPRLTASLLILLPCYYGHLVIAATPLLRPPCYYGHLDIIATSILWPPRYYGHLVIMTTSLSFLFQGTFNTATLLLCGQIFDARC